MWPLYWLAQEHARTCQDWRVHCVRRAACANVYVSNPHEPEVFVASSLVTCVLFDRA